MVGVHTPGTLLLPPRLAQPTPVHQRLGDQGHSRFASAKDRRPPCLGVLPKCFNTKSGLKGRSKAKERDTALTECWFLPVFTRFGEALPHCVQALLGFLEHPGARSTHLLISQVTFSFCNQ